MKIKLLFALFVLVLLSASVIAVKETRKDTTKSGQTPQMKPGYSMYKQQAVALKLAAGVAGIAPGAGGSIASLALTKLAAAKEAQAQEYRRTLQQRGLGYSFYDAVSAYEDWTGLNKYGALFYTEEGLAKRRQMAADYFCEHALGILGGKGCWQSRICEPYYQSKEMPPGQSVLVAQQGVGGFLPAVSVQGEKSLPITYQEAGKAKVKHIYKITYSIANPNKNRQMVYHVRLVGDAHSWESDAMTLEGATDTATPRDDRLGGNPFVTESEYDYHTVCLAFSPRIRASDWSYVSELCSPLMQYEGAATRPYTPEAAS